MLHLINDDERLTYDEGEGWKLFYRRTPESVYNAFVRKRTNAKGETNYAAVGRDVFEYAILGWEGIADRAKEVDFSLELAQRLPAKHRGKLVELSSGNAAEELGNDLKNLPSTPASSSTTTD